MSLHKASLFNPYFSLDPIIICKHFLSSHHWQAAWEWADSQQTRSGLLNKTSGNQWKNMVIQGSIALKKPLPNCCVSMCLPSHLWISHSFVNLDLSDQHNESYEFLWPKLLQLQEQLVLLKGNHDRNSWKLCINFVQGKQTLKEKETKHCIYYCNYVVSKKKYLYVFIIHIYIDIFKYCIFLEGVGAVKNRQGTQHWRFLTFIKSCLCFSSTRG